MDDFADEDRTHQLTPQEVNNYKSNWWLRSKKICSDTVRTRRRSDFKQALSTLQQLKEKEEAQRNQRWTKSYSSSWWSWQGSRWTPYSYESHHGDVSSTCERARASARLHRCTACRIDLGSGQVLREPAPTRVRTPTCGGMKKK